MKAWKTATGAVVYVCPGCGSHKAIPLCGIWTFNGDFDSPTLHPSVKVESSGCHATITAEIAHFAEDSAFTPCQNLPLEDRR